MERRLSDRELSAICLELSLFLHAGISVGDGLALMAEGERANGAFLRELAEQVDRGDGLARALRASGQIPGYLWGLVEMGERSGHMEEALSALARYYEQRDRQDQQLRATLLYPSMLMLVMLVVIVILLARVLPIFDSVYAGLGGQLTGVAGGLLALGRGLDRIMPPLAVLLAAAAVLLALFACSGGFRGRLLGWLRRRCGDSGLFRKLGTAQFAQALSMGLSSGLPLEEALSVSASVLEDTPGAQTRCREGLRRLEAGETLAKAMEGAGLLPPEQCRLLEVGLRGGAGDAAMEQIARRLTDESEDALELRLGQVEPAMVAVASVLVGLILLSVMLPLMDIMSAIG